MIIFHLSHTPLSGAVSNLAACQTKYGHDVYEYYTKQESNSGIYFGGPKWSNTSYRDLEAQLKAADVIHFHNFFDDHPMMKLYPDLMKIVREKMYLIQIHSDRENPDRNFDAFAKHHELRGHLAVIAQYQAAQYPEADFIVPNVIPLFLSQYKLSLDRFSLPRQIVSYSPSNILCTGKDYKGFDVIEPILNKLHKEGLILKETIINTPHKDCLAKKRLAAIGIEELFSGSYHISFLEYMAFGCACLANIDDGCLEAIAKVAGQEAADSLPYVFTTPGNLEMNIRMLLNHKKALIDIGESSRKWMETYWHPKQHVEYFDKIYSQL